MSIVKRNYSKFSIESLFAFFVVLCAGGGSTLQSVLYTVNGSVIGTIIVLIICFLIIIKHLKEINLNNLAILIAFLFVWGMIGTLQDGQLRNYFYVIYNIFTSYTLFLAFKKRIFKKYVDIVSYFAVLSLILFILCLLFPPLYHFFQSFSYKGNYYVDLIVFRMMPMQNEGLALIPYQNAGFAWEPGRYSAILAIAIFIEMVQNQFKILTDKKFWILFITLLTTQSTTGYICLLVILLMCSLRTKYKTIAITLVGALLVAFSTYSFLNDKIIDLFQWEENQRSNFAQYVYWRTENNEAYVPERFEGLTYDYLNFINDPVFGYGVTYKNSYMNTVLFPGATIAPSNGSMQIFASCGFVIALLFYYFLFKSSTAISNTLRYTGSWWFFALFLLINMSYNFWFITIFTLFVMYDFYEKTLRNNSHL